MLAAPTYALIDTTAIKHNLVVVGRYATDCKVMAVIKADAYGHGLLTIAKALRGVDAFAVARTDEGIKLRKAGFTEKITVLEGFIGKQELNKIIQYKLETVIHSETQLEVLENQQGMRKIAVWLKLDVGMNRLGFNVDEYLSIYNRLQHCDFVQKPISLMTHLSNADHVRDAITLNQITLFNTITNKLKGEKSIANSAAILAYPNSLVDWIRPGIMLYGVSPFEDNRELDLKPVMSLHSRLIAIKHIKAGETVGYSGTWKCKKNTRLGVVAIGYGDGYPRHVKNGTPVLINGERACLVGRVSMDMVTVDLSGLSHANVGDSVTLWGQGLLVEEIASYADTIPYTLLCGVTQRVKIKTLS